jgi:photosystem II stability/assembly factor-like uncharacterized protein
MTLRRSITLVLAVAPVLLALACTGKGDDDGGPDPDPDPDPDPSFWLVGDQGTMLAVTAGGEPSTYPLEHDEDLRAIACLGEHTAWVVGDAGTVLRSRDAGLSWDTIELGKTGVAGSVDWTALAVAEASTEPLESVWLVGSDGAIAHTPDGGSSWIVVDGVAVDFTGVASSIDGSDALAVADDGSIWQLDHAGASVVHQVDVPLYAIGRSTHGARATAVGADGIVLASTDGGATWLELDRPTTHDLYAVRVDHDGQLSVAVGEAGVVVRLAADGAEVTEWADVGLYGLHLRHDGRGQAVGEAGTLLTTADAGLTWALTSLPTTATLRGVDDFHVGGHY